MKMGLKELQKELAETRATIVDKQKDVDFYKDLEQSLLKQMEDLQRSEEPSTKATILWCRITNALIRKYKPMTEEDPNRALKELTRIEGALLAGGFLTEQELKEAL